MWVAQTFKGAFLPRGLGRASVVIKVAGSRPDKVN
jgi:hypothetical protein